MIRNDYTFIKRLEKLAEKYEQLDRINSSDTEAERYFRMCDNLYKWIYKMQEDMLLKALHKYTDE